MPIEPIKIPQNVHIEDRIVGPLTLKQVLIVTVGCGFSYGIYSVMLRSFGGLPLPVTAIVWIPGVLSVAFAFFRINDLSLLRICVLMLERMNKPMERTWSPRKGIAINIRTFSTPDEKHKRKFEEALALKNPQMIGELSSMLDQETRAQRKEALSPLEEIIDEPVTQSLPVNPLRISASEIVPGANVDTLTPPKTGAVSIFRDISPVAHG